MTAEVREILLNREVIAVDQDPLGKQGRRIVQRGATEVWLKPLSAGAAALALFNRGETDAVVEAKWSDLGLSGEQQVRDLWTRRDLGRIEQIYSASIPRHGSSLLRVSPVQ